MHKLRKVRLPSQSGAYTLETWSTGCPPETTGNRHYIGHRLTDPNGAIIFEGTDYGVSPRCAIDSDDALRGILGFMTLTRYDMQMEDWNRLTDAQKAFAESDAEVLQLWALEGSEDWTAEPFEEIEEEG